MDVNWNRFTKEARQAYEDAVRKALGFNHQRVDVKHLLAALLDQPEGPAGTILAKAGVNVTYFRKRLEQELQDFPKNSTIGGTFSQMPERLRFLLTQEAAREGRYEYISVEHLLLGMAALAKEEGDSLRHLFEEFGLTYERLMRAIQDLRTT